ncbi:MAG: cation diffusion facilitator family transporter [Deltaproteobacteria bacterium]|nr:cation diffusion facilitator family transporter [Deltaproteobacteria bacterium]
MAGQSGSAVVFAIIGNAILTLAKAAAFFFSRSPSMLSEAMHSLADTANQALLYIGIRRSQRPADRRYHWGYGGERFLFALISAVGIFVLGCGVTVYHGVHSLLHPSASKTTWITFAVLGVSLVIDGFVFALAYREVNQRRGGEPFFQFVRNTSDPTLLAVLFEDFVATVGVVVALSGLALAQVTGDPRFDAAASIVIGLMLGAVAVWLAWRNRELILGPAIPHSLEQQVRGFLLAQPSVEAVRHVRTRIVASERFAFAAEVDYDGRYLGRRHAQWLAEQVDAGLDATELAAEFGHRMLTSLALEIDRIEQELRARFPRLAYLDLESDDNPRLAD